MSSVKSHYDIGVTQRIAWFTFQQIRVALVLLLAAAFEGPVGADKTNICGIEKNGHETQKLKGIYNRI